jgi:hypothetical protein
LVEFVLTDIEVDFTCTSDWAEEPQNGTFVALTFEVETFPELGNDEWFGSFSMSSYDFTVFSPDGTRENDSDGNSFMCLDEGDELPYDMGPGEKASGKIVLDTAHPSGVIVYSTYSTGGEAGWEWSY